MELLEHLGLPPCNRQRIPVKTLVQQLQASPKQQKLLESHAASMYLVSLLNEQTIRIRSYKDDDHSFQVIYVFEIELKVNDSMSELTELIHSAFPESTLLLIKYKEKNYISGAVKRINKVDNAKSVIEDSIWTEVLDGTKLNFRSINAFDLRAYYKEIISCIYRAEVETITGIYPTKDIDYKTILKKYELLNSEITKLKEQYSIATMKAEKIRIDDELYDKEIEMKDIIKRLKGEM